MNRFFPAALRTVLVLASACGGMLLSGCSLFAGGTPLIEATGNVEMTETIISSKVTGKVEQIMVQEGQKVRQGTLLIQLDHEDLGTQIAAAKANLTLASLRFQKTSHSLRLAEKGQQNKEMKAIRVRLAENNKNATKADYEEAERDLERMTKLYGQELISKAEYDHAVTARDVSRSQYFAAENQLAITKNASESDDIFLDRSQTEAQLKQAEAALTLLQTQLKNSQIAAPVQGVISAKLTEIGEVVTAGTPLFTILDSVHPWVKIYLPLLEVERVSLNQKALIHVDAFPDRQYTGHISFISDEAEFTPKNYQSKEERVKQVYAVKIELDNGAGIFKAGMPVDVAIATKKKASAAREDSEGE